MENSTKQTFRIFLTHALKHKISVLVVLFSLAAAVAAGIIVPIFYSEFFNIISENTPTDELIRGLITLLLAILGLNLAGWLFWRILFFTYVYFSAKSIPSVANTCFETINFHSYRFFTNNFVGSLVKKVSRFVNAYEKLCDDIIWDLAPMLIELVAIFIILGSRNLIMGVILVLWAIVFIFINNT